MTRDFSSLYDFKRVFTVESVELAMVIGELVLEKSIT